MFRLAPSPLAGEGVKLSMTDEGTHPIHFVGHPLP